MLGYVPKHTKNKLLALISGNSCIIPYKIQFSLGKIPSLINTVQIKTNQMRKAKAIYSEPAVARSQLPPTAFWQKLQVRQRCGKVSQ